MEDNLIDLMEQIEYLYTIPLLEWVNSSLYKKYGTISKEDMDLYHVVDSVDEAYKVIMKKVDLDAKKQV